MGRSKRFEKSIEFTENVLEEKVAKVEQNVFELNLRKSRKM